MTTDAAFAYLGWDRKGNLGDLAIRQAYEHCLPGHALVALPSDHIECSSVAGTAAAERLRPLRLLLGGGTVLGRRHWRFVLSRGLQLAAARPALMMGAGVEDPRFQGKYSGSDHDELGNWPPLLADFDRLTVRGPLSAELLADYGVDSKVVGDPALLLDPGPAAEPDEILGVSLGFGNDLWSHDQRRVVERVAQAVARILRCRRWRVRFLVLNAQDLRWTHECIALMATAPAGCEVVTTDRPEAFFAAAAPCLVIIGERLHSVILASAAGIPAVMLEYQPKCSDFMSSIGRAQWSFRTDRFTAEELAEAALFLADDRDRHVAQIGPSVARLRALLRAEIERIRYVALQPPRGLLSPD